MTTLLRPAIISAIISAALACHGSSSDSDAPKPEPAKVDPADSGAPAVEDPPAANAGTSPGPPSDGVDELHRLEGQAEAALIEEFGDPTSTSEFRMADCCHEFEIELYNTYPPNAGHDDVRIRQWNWDYDGYTLTVWLHEVAGAWTVLETSRYSDDVDF